MPRTTRASMSGFISKTSRQTRINLGQSPDRPLRLRQKSSFKNEFVSPNPWWWMTHRRGIHRPKVGQDPLEARAVSKALVRGTLPERIVYQYLLNLHMVPEVDFDFQSSMQGGRLFLGGIVVDFLFPNWKMIIQVQGPTHDQFARSRKDEEQRQILENMGYRLYYMDMQLIYNEPRFEDYMRYIFNLGNRISGGEVFGGYTAPEEDDGESDMLESIMRRVDQLVTLFRLLNIMYSC